MSDRLGGRGRMEGTETRAGFPRALWLNLELGPLSGGKTCGQLSGERVVLRAWVQPKRSLKAGKHLYVQG